MTKNLVFFGLIFILLIVCSYIFHNCQYFIEEFTNDKLNNGIYTPYAKDANHLTRKLKMVESQKNPNVFGKRYKNLYGANYDYYYGDGFIIN
jgi:hypothetical protein